MLLILYISNCFLSLLLVVAELCVKTLAHGAGELESSSAVAAHVPSMGKALAVPGSSCAPPVLCKIIIIDEGRERTGSSESG